MILEEAFLKESQQRGRVVAMPMRFETGGEFLLEPKGQNRAPLQCGDFESVVDRSREDTEATGDESGSAHSVSRPSAYAG